jgi:carboxypeptidase PM20D1
VKRIAAVLLVVVLGLAGVVVIRAAGLTSRQVDPAAIPFFEVDPKGVTQRLALSIRLRTISHQDRDRIDRRAFREMAGLLRAYYPATHRRLTVERVNDLSLLYTWKGRNPELEPVLLAAHLDVVPVDPASIGDWTHPPFEGVVQQGVVWGRGAIDDKASVITIMEAVEGLVAEGHRPERTVYLAFGHDEEVGGYEGALAIAKLLEERGVRLAWVLDEGGLVAKGMVPGVRAQVAVVGLAEKGSVTIGLEIDAPGGHSSAPPIHSAIGDLAQAIVRLENNQMPSRIDGVTGTFLDTLAPELPFAARLVLANRWLFGGLLNRGFGELPPFAAMTRTTTAVTMVEAGVKENVLPVRASAVVNLRIHPRDSVDGVVDHVRETIDDPRVRLQLGLRTPPREPSPASPPDAEAFVALQRTIRSVFPDTVVAPYLVLGGTDGRHYYRISDNVFRFGPYVMGGDALKLAHGTNERITTANLMSGVRFFRQLLLDSAASLQSSSE